MVDFLFAVIELFSLSTERCKKLTENKRIETRNQKCLRLACPTVGVKYVVN